MCQEQKALRVNFQRFAQHLTEQGIDFQMGVTTTQMNDEFPLDPVAHSGQLQSTPQPVPSDVMGCWGDPGDPDDPMDGFAPIRDKIATAIGCAKDPSKWQDLLQVTDDEIQCHLNHHCGNMENLFPQPDGGQSPYRELPKVIRSTDYSADNKVDLERIAKDFACMSFVGTRGYFFEKGLGAAVKAVSPQLTGGSVEAPTDESAPNHGLFRRDSRTALIFVSDENDCTHDGSLDEKTVCGDDVCAFANNPNFPNSPLIDPSELADEFLTNLSATKGREVSPNEITVASIVGAWKRYGETSSYPAGQAPMSFDMCNSTQQPLDDDLHKQPACQSAEFGTAFSGDRYDRFMRNFPVTYPPVPDAPDQHIPGIACHRDQIPATLSAIGETAARSGHLDEPPPF